MIRWIDADALKEKMDDLCEWKCKYTIQEKREKCKACPMGMAFDLVKDADYIANKPRKHGYMVKNGGWYWCSACGDHWAEDGANYCPNCGAEMDEVEDGKID